MRKFFPTLFMLILVLIATQTACTPAAPTAVATSAPTTEATAESAEEATADTTADATESPTEEATEAATEEATAETTESAMDEATEESAVAAVATAAATESATEEATEETADAEETEATTDATEEATASADATEEATEAVDNDTAQPQPTPIPRTREELETLLGWTCPEEARGGTLNIYNWASYVGPTTIPDFEILCEATANFDVYASNEDMIARLRQGNPGYDIIVPSHFIIAVMIEEGLLTPLTLENIPNIANVTEGLLHPNYDPENQYTVPYQWGTVGIAYSTVRVTEPMVSWNDLWAYEGPVAWLEDQRAMLSIALTMLGYDPNSENPDEINEARDYLIANSSNVITLNTGNSQQLLDSGQVDAAIDYNGNVFQLQAACGCDDYAYVIPSEGANIWVDNVAIPVDAPNARLAEAFIDYLLSPQVGADLSNYTAYATPNQAALDAGLIDPAMRENPAIYPDASVLERTFFSEANPATEMLYADAWDAVKAALSR